MLATHTLPTPATVARRAGEVHAAWTADEDMPAVAGCAGDAVRVLAVRAALYEQTGDEETATLAAPEAVELSARVLAAQFPELTAVAARSGHRLVHGREGERWEPHGYLHRVYEEAFGPAGGRHWPV